MSTFLGARGIYPPAKLHQEILSTLHKEVTPALQGQLLSGFQTLLEKVRPIIEAEDDQTPADLNSPDALPNHDSFNAWTSPPPPPLDRRPPTEGFSENEWIRRAIGLGVSQALLEALADTHNLTKAEVIAEEYNLPQPKDIPHILVMLDRLHTRVGEWVTAYDVAAIGVTTPGNKPRLELGRNGELLQRAVRNLNKRLQEVGASPERTTIHLDVRGGMGQLYQFDSAKIIGSLSKLEQEAMPYPLQVQNPVMMATLDSQIKLLSEIKHSLRINKRRVKLVADGWTHSVEHIEKIVQSKATDLIHISLPKLGNMDQTLQALTACKSAGQPFILSAASTSRDRWADLTCHLAFATQADYLAIHQTNLAHLTFPWYQQEMSRTHAWINSRSSPVE